ncbi:DNA polymerase III subunit gamma/tau [Collinsella tanakaei]|uniref:DNA polymerase III subunit gamma/tau n=1 Tax=Collinsella tanakaei TaxID=626935 RepID=UPI001956400A|nr:DNA polymerase III subunit gamma/tau [Collinsella tanakaei]
MESLYRKYRPLTFESVVGQQHIVSTLEHAVQEGRLSHAYLFCGPRGTGKTTMARILAKALLCEHADAARAQGASGCMPDGTCPECEAIAEGTHPDVYELDAASRTGVDSVREEIISSVNFAPVRGAYKVYIIDEVHMLTAAAFNALLKTLEEPPSHVVFILCTTDPQKILETILSRCQRFDFHRISNEDIVGRLRYICEQEGFDTDDEALEIVARHARGGMRDALSTLEQLSVFGDGAVRVSDARALLGEVASTVLAEFATAIAARDVVGLFGMVRAQVDEGNDLLEFTRDLVAHVRDVYTACVAGNRPELFDGTPDEVAALVDEASRFEGADRLARVLTVLDDAAIEMRGASDPRLVLEIACTRLARPESDLTLEALAERLDRIEGQLAVGVPSAPLDAAGIAALTGTPARPGAARAAAQADARDVSAARGSRQAGAGVASPAAQAAPWDAPARPSATPSMSAGDTNAAPAATPSAPARPAAATTQQAVPAAPKQPVEPEAKPAEAPAPAAREEQPRPVTAAPEVEAAAQPAAPAAPVAPQPAPAPSPASQAPQPDAAPASASVPAAADAGELQRKWTEVVKRVTAAQASRGALLQSSRAASDDGSRLVVGFPKGSNFAIKMLGRADSHELIMPIVAAVFGPRAVDYVIDGAAPSAASSPQTAPAESALAASENRPATPAPAAPAGHAAPSAPAVNAAPAQAPTSRAAAPAQVPAAQTPRAAAGAVSAPSAAPASVAAPSASPQTAEAVPAQPVEDLPWGPVAGSKSAAPAVPQVDQVSGPTIVPEPDVDADRRAWEDEQVPYDDATIASYEDDDVPPFGAPAGIAPAPVPAAPAPQPKQPAPPAAPVQPPHRSAAPLGAAPWVGAPTPASDEAQVPQTEEEAKEMLSSIFGNVVFKDANE